ncbi:hypothetical protein PR048_016307 [Dryococelus australis]|uniref:Uncharacterized protein n=1 Tax=Dryococelus australis TaxID=614101 RepID=A0ABQ9HJJ8_9NEOP|nr:hypothetical protein PR048_016307 [Dryococelus australis]
MRVKQSKYGAAPECKGGGNRRPPRKPINQRHCLTQLPHAKIWDQSHWDSNPSKWVPHTLLEANKQQRVIDCFSLLSQHASTPTFDLVLTGDKKWGPVRHSQACRTLVVTTGHCSHTARPPYYPSQVVHYEQWAKSSLDQLHGLSSKETWPTSTRESGLVTLALAQGIVFIWEVSEDPDEPVPTACPTGRAKGITKGSHQHGRRGHHEPQDQQAK